jgi:hypothetical protein
MRRVAHAAELVDLMLDAAYAQMPRTDTTGQPWQQRVTAIAEENRALFEAHPWTATVSTTRPPLGLVAKYEHELSALDGLGLDDVEMDAALTYLLSFVQSCARDATAVRISQQDSAMDDQQWWAANAPLLVRVFDAEAYPIAPAWVPRPAPHMAVRTALTTLTTSVCVVSSTVSRPSSSRPPAIRLRMAIVRAPHRMGRFSG